MTLIGEQVYPGLWECGHCHAITDHTHFYQDRATGEMRHEAKDEYRKKLAAQCGWRFDDSYGPVDRCDMVTGHEKYGGYHHRGGPYPVKWSSNSLGARKPYEHRSTVTEGEDDGRT